MRQRSIFFGPVQGFSLSERKRGLIDCALTSFPIFRKYFQKHGKRKPSGLRLFLIKGLYNYDLSNRVNRGIEIAYVNSAHP
jgi:hypothetical protein